MKFNETLFEDMSRLASGAASALSGLREQVEAHSPFARPAPVHDSVSRAEFEAVAAMAAKAREVQDALLKRIAALEAQIGINKTTDETVAPGGDEI